MLPSVLAVGISVDVVLWIGQNKLAFKAFVRSADRVGNGIEFTGISDEQRGHLQRHFDDIKKSARVPVMFR